VILINFLIHIVVALRDYPLLFWIGIREKGEICKRKHYKLGEIRTIATE